MPVAMHHVEQIGKRPETPEIRSVEEFKMPPPLYKLVVQASLSNSRTSQ